MSAILIRTFDTEQDAKDHFAVIVQSTELHGAFITQAGTIFLDGAADPIVATNKWVVISTGSEVIDDIR